MVVKMFKINDTMVEVTVNDNARQLAVMKRALSLTNMHIVAIGDNGFVLEVNSDMRRSNISYLAYWLKTQCEAHMVVENELLGDELIFIFED